MRKEDEAYMVRKGEADIARLAKQQEAETNRRNISFKSTIAARDVRKKSKQVLRAIARDTKVLLEL